MFTEDQKLDDELAQLTDELLAGKLTSPSDNLKPLYRVVEQIYQTVDPKNTPSAAFRVKLQKQLLEEWNQQNNRVIRPLWRYRGVQVGAIAATLLITFGVAYVLIGNVSNNNSDNAATALDSGWEVLFIVGIVALMIGIFLYWRGND